MHEHDVEFTDEFEAWWAEQDEAVQISINAKVQLLERFGPALGRPYVDTLKETKRHKKHLHMKELRIPEGGQQYRILFCFDPVRTAILLIGGNKLPKPKEWYEKTIPIAEKLYDAHLVALKFEGIDKHG